MKKQLLLKSALIAVLLPVGTAALRLIFYYSSFSNILINIKDAPASEAFPILVQTIATVCILLTFFIQNKSVSLLLCIISFCVSLMLSPLYSVVLLPVILGFWAVRFKVYELKNGSDMFFVIFTIIVNALACTVLFTAKVFHFDFPLSLLSQQMGNEISIPFIIACAVITVGIIAVLLITKKAMAAFWCLLFAAFASFIVSLIFYNQVTDKEYYNSMGYIVLFIYALYENKKLKFI